MIQVAHSIKIKRYLFILSTISIVDLISRLLLLCQTSDKRSWKVKKSILFGRLKSLTSGCWHKVYLIQPFEKIRKFIKYLGRKSLSWPFIRSVFELSRISASWQLKNTGQILIPCTCARAYKMTLLACIVLNTNKNLSSGWKSTYKQSIELLTFSHAHQNQ